VAALVLVTVVAVVVHRYRNPALRWTYPAPAWPPSDLDALILDISEGGPTR